MEKCKRNWNYYCVQLPQNVGGICPQEYRNSFWKLDVTLIWGALPQNVGWRHLLWAETSLHPDYPFKVQRYTCHHHTIVIATFTVTITSNMWFPIYRIASHTTTRFRSLVLEPPLEPSSCWCNIFMLGRLQYWQRNHTCVCWNIWDWTLFS